MKKRYAKKPASHHAKKKAAAKRRKAYATRDKRAAKFAGLTVREYRRRRATAERKRRAIVESIPHKAMVEMLMGKRTMDPQLEKYLRASLL